MSWGIQESNLSRLTRTVHEAMHAEERPLYKKVERFVWLLIALSMATFGLELALPQITR